MSDPIKFAVPCLPGTGLEYEVFPGHTDNWACAVCGQPGTKDCLVGPHQSMDPADWWQPEVVQEYLAGT
jgi:hypothetical protein